MVIVLTLHKCGFMSLQIVLGSLLSNCLFVSVFPTFSIKQLSNSRSTYEVPSEFSPVFCCSRNAPFVDWMASSSCQFFFLKIHLQQSEFVLLLTLLNNSFDLICVLEGAEELVNVVQFRKNSLFLVNSSGR